MINGQYERAKALLTEHKEGHAELARVLMEREVIFAEDVEKIFGKRPWASRSEEIIEKNAEKEESTPVAEENTLAGESTPETTDEINNNTNQNE